MNRMGSGYMLVAAEAASRGLNRFPEVRDPARSRNARRRRPRLPQQPGRVPTDARHRALHAVARSPAPGFRDDPRGWVWVAASPAIG